MKLAVRCANTCSALRLCSELRSGERDIAILGAILIIILIIFLLGGFSGHFGGCRGACAERTLRPEDHLPCGRPRR